MSGGGSSGTNRTIVDVPEWQRPYFQSELGTAQALQNQPYMPYQGQRTAPLNSLQQLGIDATANRAMQGSALNQAAGQSIMGTLGGSGVNPYLGYNAGYALTPQSAGTVTAGTNQYAGQNPFLQNAINASKHDITQTFGDQTANLGAQFQKGGAFGGSAWQEMQARNNGELARNLGNVENSMRMQDYGMQQNLAENAINRGLQAQQFNVGTNLADLARGLQAQQFNIGTNLSDLARNSGLYESERARQMQAIGMAPQLANQDYVDLQALQQAGGQLQNYDQALRDEDYGNFADARDWALNRYLATKGYATIPPGRSTTEPGRSRGASALGGALAGATLGGIKDTAGSAIFGSMGPVWGALGGGLLSML